MSASTSVSVRKDPRYVLALTVVAGTIARIPQLSHSLYDSHAFRQTQTAFVIREYARQGTDLLVTPLPVFGAGSNVPMEMPLFQGLAAQLMRLGLSAEMAGRTLGLVGFQLSAILLWTMVSRWFAIRPAHVAVVLMQVMPFGLAWGGSSLIDFTSVALGLGTLVALDGYVRSGGAARLVIGTVSVWACALVKVTTAMPWCVLLLFAFAAIPRSRRGLTRASAALAAGPGMALVAAALWTRFADAVKAGQPATRFLTSHELAAWNYGDLSTRTSGSSIAGLGFHSLLEVGAPLGIGLLVAAFGAIAGRGSRLHRWGLVTAVVSGPLVFFNLYSVHSYYWIAVFPMLITLMALGLVAGVDRLGVPTSSLVRTTVLATALLVVSAGVAPVGSSQIAQFTNSRPVPDLSTRLAALTQPDEEVLIIGCDWDPTLLYGADRHGFMIRNTSAASLPARAGMDTFRHLFSCDAALDPQDFLPSGWVAVPTHDPALYGVERGVR